MKEMFARKEGTGWQAEKMTDARIIKTVLGECFIDLKFYHSDVDGSSFPMLD
jgi:hypothetical protein